MTPTSAQFNAAAASFSRLTSKLDYLSAADLTLVKLAYRFADAAHLGQVRNSGEPYVTHPIAVAALCADWKLDAQALMAALLHDTIEDCAVTKTELIERFGSPVADLVDGLTKLDKLHINTTVENQSESFRKMLLAMARDVRVILIKLADRTHNMRTLSNTQRIKWHRIASETLDIYAPIAYRLGLNQAYRELQDLSFQYMRPWRYAVLSKAIAKARGRKRDLIQKVQSSLEAALTGHGMTAKVAGREKSLFSIYTKMVSKNLSFAQVTDVYGFRVILPFLIDCYTALGLLHQLYRPVPGKFKDHIAIKKINGYQSLHTTLVVAPGVSVEVQLRTEGMHRVAETGVAAHWLYKENGHHHGSRADPLGSKWLQSLLDLEGENRDATEFWDHVKLDLFPDDVYVFTPKSKILALPRGATVIDFAYAIHSSVGEHASKATIHNEPVPLHTEVRNGDVVAIITSADVHPTPAWLEFARTARARSKIRQHLKTMAQADSERLGETLLTQALRAEGFERLPSLQTDAVWDKLLRFSGNRTCADLLTEMGLGRRIARIVAKRLSNLLMDAGHKPDPLLLTHEHFTHGDTVSHASVLIDGSENASVRIGKCCMPIPGDRILGYLGRGDGLTVHIDDCPVAKKLKHKESDRFIAVEWSDSPVCTFQTGVMVTVTNGQGVLAKVAGVFAASEADITHIHMSEVTHNGEIGLGFTIAVRDLQQLETVLKNLRHTTAVVNAQRNPLASNPHGGRSAVP